MGMMLFRVKSMKWRKEDVYTVLRRGYWAVNVRAVCYFSAWIGKRVQGYAVCCF